MIIGKRASKCRISCPYKINEGGLALCIVYRWDADIEKLKSTIARMALCQLGWDKSVIASIDGDMIGWIVSGSTSPQEEVRPLWDLETT